MGLSIPKIKLLYDNLVIVSKNGDDETADGSYTKSYLTVKAAIDFVTSQNPTIDNPWTVYIFPGVYLEERGTWINNQVESSMIVPDYCFIVGMNRESVIIKPDGNVPGEDMNLFGAIQEIDKSTTASSHIGFSNLTLQDCLYGDAIQVDSFIKKPDYPEFRVYVDNVKFVNCETGIKCEERNSWGFVNQVYFEDCNRSLHVDDAKIFAEGVVVRQKNSVTPLSSALYAEDGKGKIQVFDLEVGIDKEGLDVAYDSGIRVEDEAEIHAYSVRIDNCRRAIRIREGGEFKGWSIKLHDSDTADIDMNGADPADKSKVEIFNGELDGLITVGEYSDLHLRDITVDADKHDDHLLTWDSAGKLEIGNAILKSTGLKGGQNYRCINIERQPSTFTMINSFLRYDHSNSKPDYLAYSTVTVSGADVRNTGMESGMNGNIVVPYTTKNVGGEIDYYSTINDAINVSSVGNTVLVNPGTYEEQITMKPGVTIQGINKDICILQFSDEPIQPWTVGGGLTSIQNMTIQTTVINNTIVELRNGYYDLFINCEFNNGIIKLIGANLTGFPQFEFEKCNFKQSGGYSIEASGNTSKNTKIVLKNCRFKEETSSISWTLTGSGWMRILELQNTNVLWGTLNIAGNCDLTIDGGSHYADGGTNINFGSTGYVNISKATYNADGGYTINFSTAPSSFSFLSNVIKDSLNYDIYASVDVTGIIIGNSMFNGMNGHIKTSSSTKYIQGGIDFHKTIQDGIDASSSGDSVLISPGSYNEQITMKTGVKVVGTDKNVCVLERTELPIVWNHGTWIVIENLTIQTTVQGNDIARPTAGVIHFKNCIIQNGTINVNANNMTNNVGLGFTDSMLLSNDTSTPCIYTSGDSGWRWCMLQCWNSEFAEPGGGVNWNCTRSSSSYGNTFQLYDSRMSMGEMVINGDPNPEIIGGQYYSEHAGAVWKINTPRKVKFNNVYFPGGNEMIHFTQNPSEFQFINCLCASTWGTYDIDGDVDITDVKLYGNGMSKGLSGKIQITNALKNVAGGQDFYTTIQSGIDASIAGSLISIYPGTYTEQVTLKTGVTIQGLDKDTVILQRSSDPIIFDSSYADSIVQDMTIQVSTNGNRVIDFTRRSCKLYNCLIKNGYVSMDNITTNTWPELHDCILTPAGGVDALRVDDTSGTGAYCMINAFDCRFDGNIYFKTTRGKLKLTRSYGWANIIYEATTNNVFNDLIMTDCEFTFDTADILNVQKSATGVVDEVTLTNCLFDADGASNCIRFQTNPTNTTIIGCTMRNAWEGGGKYDISVDAGITISGAKLISNIMTTGIGGSGIFAHINPIKYVDGGIDCYATTQHALDGVNFNNQKIVLKADQIVTTPLLPPSYQIIIDGLHQFNITRNAGIPLMTLSANDSVKFVNIDLRGSIDVTGNNTHLELADHTYLNGMIDLQSGNSAGSLKLDQCKILGDSVDNYCIRINTTAVPITIKRSYLKSNGTNPAIYWNVDNDVVKLAYTSVMNGALGANNPFGCNGALTIDYYSHHCMYNSTPTSSGWTNLIGTHYDIYDPDGDY